jgi:hypothetical protein
MRKPIEDKGPLAAWATLARAEAGMSVEEAVAALAERGHAVTAATIRGIEGGSKGASSRLRKLLAAVYGTNPPGTGLEATETPDVVAAAIREQTTALVSAIQARDAVIEALLEELATYRRQTIERQETERSLLEALPEALAIALGAKPANGHVDEQPATLPREAAGRR